MRGPYGCDLTPLTPAQGEQVWEWAVAGGPAVAGLPETHWLLAHCHGGVVWGRRDGAGWQLGHSAFPRLVPVLAKDSVLQLRLFGPAAEVLLWRSGSGLSGRILASTGNEVASDHPLRPREECQVLIGDRLWRELPARNGFTAVADATGSRHVVPLTCTADDFRGHWSPLRLRVQHYLAMHPEHGTVRTVASRLVDVFKEVRR